MNTSLYPLKFKPILKNTIWGGNKLRTILNKESNEDNIGESWELSGVQGDVSVVSNGFLEGNSLEEIIEIYMGEIVGDPVFNKFDKEFPLLFKFIDATQDLSIQVHPNDNIARERHNAYGKTEMWYVIDAEQGSQLISGFNEPSSKEQYLEAFKKNEITSLLKSHKVEREDAFFIPAGEIHAIGAGILLAEIQQTSDVTYRIYDYNRKDASGKERELHTDLALDVIDYKSTNDKISYDKNDLNETVNIAACEYFVTNFLNLTETLLRDVYLLNSFVVYMCTEGSATIICENGTKESIKKGETILVPASIQSIEITPDNSCKLLEVYIKL
ncbi:type I phosphomannose isomerase catalytic subunit [Plebeiibacterium sediminum]|uniref:Class I mannose-6-phosphate isomerase n=1 Tax=Plebeiibacterium sediminum TaxID=2992112 RepID=A0AAE3SGU0_9BACT|nr:type I phosphomannose isomerase catalytic subunit [Plebeiobacterium sediminum]MCW3788462.1 class I mannose-6-phosphate isomerase [Plebeiobacterium sediminum]